MSIPFNVLKNAWRRPLTILPYLKQALGSEEELTDKMLHEYVSQSGIIKDAKIYHVATCVPWWDGDTMPCAQTDLQEASMYGIPTGLPQFDTVSINNRWAGRYNVLRERIRPAIHLYLTNKAKTRYRDYWAKLLCISGILNHYNGFTDIRYGYIPEKPIDMLYPKLEVDFFKFEHYRSLHEIVEQHLPWFTMYAMLIQSLYCKLPRELILICAKYNMFFTHR